MTDQPEPGRDEELPPTDEVVVEQDDELDILDLEDDPAYSPEDDELKRMKGG